jgi:hypothetical protein
MQFNKTICKILERYVSASDIPVLDGEREVYSVCVTYTRSSHVTPLERVTEETNWWVLARHWSEKPASTSLVTEFTDFKLAREAFLKLLNLHMVPWSSQLRAQDEIDKLAAVHGTFKVVDEKFDLDMRYDLYFGVEVDQDAYKPSAHAAEELKDF